MNVVILGRASDSTYILTNYLSTHFNVTELIIEANVKKTSFIGRRLRKIGVLKVFGQLLFKVLIERYLKYIAKSQLRSLRRENALDKSFPKIPITNVNSINSNGVFNLLKKSKPDVIIVSGTRIIKQHILEAVNSPFLNIHAGITPLFRGVHGGYWALANNQPHLAGTTVHIVDKGVDTGKVVAQGIIETDSKDNFCTYPLKQLIIGLPLLKEAIYAYQRGEVLGKPSLVSDSKIWSHPTLLEYIRNRLNGVK